MFEGIIDDLDDSCNGNGYKYECIQDICIYEHLVGWLVGWHINLCKLFNAKSIFM